MIVLCSVEEHISSDPMVDIRTDSSYLYVFFQVRPWCDERFGLRICTFHLQLWLHVQGTFEHHRTNIGTNFLSSPAGFRILDILFPFSHLRREEGNVFTGFGEVLKQTSAVFHYSGTQGVRGYNLDRPYVPEVPSPTSSVLTCPCLPMFLMNVLPDLTCESPSFFLPKAV